MAVTPVARRAPIVLSVLAASALACGPAGSSADGEPEDRVTGTESAGVGSAAAGLDSVYAVFTRAYAEADVDLLMDSVYANDGYYLPPNAPILEGTESFRGQFESFLGPVAERGGPGPDISFEIVDRDVDGDLAYDIGIYTIRRPDAPADAPGSRGKFIVIWKRGADGAWRMHADGFSAMPPES